MDYLFGKGKGNVHNIERSVSMQYKLEEIGIYDNPSGREYLMQHFDDVLNDPTNIIDTEVRSYVAKELPEQPTVQYTATIKESLLMGPRGGVKVISIWDNNRLLTVILEGGR